VLRREKEKVVTELHDHIKDSRLIVLTTFTGLNVEKMTSLRNSLREVNSKYQVVKNTLMKRAACDTALESLEDFFTGSTAVIFTDGEPISPCKVLREFQKEHEQVEVKGGMLDGKVLSQNEIKEIATLPSREVLLAMFLLLLNAPKQKFVNVLAGVPQNFVRVLEEIRKKRKAKLQ